MGPEYKTAGGVFITVNMLPSRVPKLSHTTIHTQFLRQQQTSQYMFFLSTKTLLFLKSSMRNKSKQLAQFLKIEIYSKLVHGSL